MQCATVGSFGAHWQETLYNMFTFACLFLLPLLVMVLCYGRILAAISGRMKEAGGERGGSAAAFFFSFYSLSFPFSPRYHPFLSPPPPCLRHLSIPAHFSVPKPSVPSAPPPCPTSPAH